MGRRKRKGSALGRSLLLLVLLGAAAAGYLWSTRDAPTTPGAEARGVLRVHYVDVGQGDGTIWELPDGSIVVYDCGPPAASADENPMVRYLRDTLGRPPGSRIEALVASHGHLDHVGGCDEILAEYAVADAYDAGYEGDDAPQSYRRFRAALAAEGARLHVLPEIAPGVGLVLPSASARFLWPPGFAPGGWGAIAEASLVVRLVHGETAFCFQGDIEDRQERQMAQGALEASCGVYLVGHHGSASASSDAWLARMAPSVAVASFGENAYGHPTSEALCRVQRAGATVYATYGAGAVVVESDGASVRVSKGAPLRADLCAEGASYWSAIGVRR